MLLTQQELERFADYETPMYDKSVTRRLMEPFWDQLARLVPEDIAPNMISLAALMCLVQAWYLTLTQGEEYPQETTAVAIILIFVYWTLDAIDGKHAVRIGNDSSLTVFFDHVCSAVGTTFLVLTLCQCYDVRNMNSVWHYVQMGQLLILNKHLGAFKKEYISYRLVGGPGEGITLSILTLAVRAALGPEEIDALVGGAVVQMQRLVPPALYAYERGLASMDNPLLQLSRTLFFWTFAWTLGNTLLLGRAHSVTLWSLLLCLVYLLVPSGLLVFQFELSLADVIAQGLVTAMISSDLVVARMAGRELHPWVVIANMAALGSNLFAFVLVPFYYGAVLFEMARYTRLPLLSRVSNVYFDGVFDMPHIGHMQAFKNAAKFGTRLFVGVASDESATPYKRRPVMTAKERYAVVAACRYVYKVIEDAPCVKGELNEEFLRKHRIHVVAHGEEYDDVNDEWYATPRAKGITRVLPRHDGMSTSELIRRINSRNQDELKRTAPAAM